MPKAYLAARHIAEQTDDSAIDLFMPHLNKAWWQEVHALVLSILGGRSKDAGQAAKLVNTLLNIYPKPWKPLLRVDFVGRLVRALFVPAHHERHITWFLGRELSMALQGYADARSECRDPSVTDRLKSETAEFVKRGLRLQADLDRLLIRRGLFVSELVEPELLRGLSDKESYVRFVAADALGKFGSDGPEVRNTLLKALGL